MTREEIIETFQHVITKAGNQMCRKIEIAYGEIQTDKEDEIFEIEEKLQEALLEIIRKNKELK